MSQVNTVKYLSASFLALSMLCSAVAYAQQRPDRATMQKVVTELGIGPIAMRSCFRGSGLKRGQEISAEQRANARSHLLSCFRESNPGLTEGQFQSAMTKIFQSN